MARVIAGSARGLPLKIPKGDKTKPTADRVKESLFNILGTQVVDAHVLDVFAGTGALGIECLSRGAASAVFIENDRAALRCLRDNIERSRFTEKSHIVVSRSLPTRRRLGHRPFDLIFADAPYERGFLKQFFHWIQKEPPITTDTWLIVERSEREQIPDGLSTFHPFRENTYGQTVVTFLKAKS